LSKTAKSLRVTAQELAVEAFDNRTKKENQVMRASVVLVVACVVFASGCASTIQHRGWIGGSLAEAYEPLFGGSRSYSGESGERIPALPEEAAIRQKKAVFICKIHPDTPLSQAGLREGDLILAANGTAVDSLKGFRTLVQESATGTDLKLEVYRDGRVVRESLTVGTESYRRGGHLGVGLPLWLELYVQPPEFSILHILSYKRQNVHPQLSSPEWRYFGTTESNSSYRTPQGEPYAPGKGWSTYLGLIGFGFEERILSQELAKD
jgi:membrane-associated protease RseP (regulator of RpoE activity)